MGGFFVQVPVDRWMGNVGRAPLESGRRQAISFPGPLYPVAWRLGSLVLPATELVSIPIVLLI